MARGQHGWTLTVIAVAGFMTTLDNTVVNVALPSIQRDLRVPLETLEWVATAYILVFAGVMLAGGRMADVYGRKRIFLTGVSIFTAASLLAALSRSAELLIFARVVQGAGAALVLPAGLALVTVGRTDAERARGTIVWIGAAALALALGPITGGYLSSHWHWSSIFLINVPSGVLVVIIGLLVIPASPDTTAVSLDLAGVIASCTTLFAVTFALTEGSRLGWTDPSVLGGFGLGALAATAFVIVERRARDPMIDLVFFRSRTFSGGIMVQILWGVGFNGVLFYASLFLQNVLLFSPTETGAVFLPPAIAIAALTPVSFLVARRLGARLTIGGGLVLMAGGMTAFAGLTLGDGYVDLLPGVALIGIGSAMTMPLAMYVLKAVPEERAGVAGGILSVAREVSGAFGIAVIGVIITSLQRTRMAEGADAATAFREATPYGLLAGAGLVLLGGFIAAATLPAKRRRSGRHARVPDEEPTAAGRPAEPPPSRRGFLPGWKGRNPEPEWDPWEHYGLFETLGRTGLRQGEGAR